MYGTKTTLDLVREKLGVDPRRLRLFEIGVTRRLEGVDVTFVEANHCPGAAMILFEFRRDRRRRPCYTPGILDITNACATIRRFSGSRHRRGRCRRFSY